MVFRQELSRASGSRVPSPYGWLLVECIAAPPRTSTPVSESELHGIRFLPLMLAAAGLAARVGRFLLVLQHELVVVQHRAEIFDLAVLAGAKVYLEKRAHVVGDRQPAPE